MLCCLCFLLSAQGGERIRGGWHCAACGGHMYIMARINIADVDGKATVRFGHLAYFMLPHQNLSDSM
jgi:hypothetical protein